MRAKFGPDPTAGSKNLSFKFISRRQLELAKLKVKEEPRSRTAKVSGRRKIIPNFESSSCRVYDVTRHATSVRVYGLKMIVNNVAVTPVYALWHITICAGHVSQLLIIIPWF